MDSTSILYELIDRDPKGNAGEIAGVFCWCIPAPESTDMPHGPHHKKACHPANLADDGVKSGLRIHRGPLQRFARRYRLKRLPKECLGLSCR
jgi:hypothetical protein